MTNHRLMIPVWFFVGLLLGIYGVLILASGLAEWSHPPATVLGELHAPVWWGALLAGIGGIYTVIYWPRNRPQESGGPTRASAAGQGSRPTKPWTR